MAVSTRQLRLALEVAGVAAYELDLANGRVSWYRRLEEVLGLPPTSLPDELELLVERVHPADREVREAVERAVETAEPFVLEFRLRLDDERWVWLGSRGRLTATEEGAAFVLAGARGARVDVGGVADPRDRGAALSGAGDSAHARRRTAAEASGRGPGGSGSFRDRPLRKSLRIRAGVRQMTNARFR